MKTYFSLRSIIVSTKWRILTIVYSLILENLSFLPEVTVLIINIIVSDAKDIQLEVNP